MTSSPNRFVQIVDRRTIRLLHTSMNPHHAEAFGVIFKLPYVPPPRYEPQLEVFADTPEAREADWQIYGSTAHHLNSTSKAEVARPKFSAEHKVQTIQISGSKYRITFVAVRDVEYIYRRTGKTLVPEYGFIVEKIVSAQIL